MVTKLLAALVLLVFPAYAGTCGESNGSVRCTDDVGHKSTLEALDKAISSQSGGSTLPDASSIRNEMATYPPNLRSQGPGRASSQQKGDQQDADQEKANKSTTLQMPGLLGSRP